MFRRAIVLTTASAASSVSVAAPFKIEKKSKPMSLYLTVHHNSTSLFQWMLESNCVPSTIKQLGIAERLGEADVCWSDLFVSLRDLLNR